MADYIGNITGDGSSNLTNFVNIGTGGVSVFFGDGSNLTGISGGGITYAKGTTSWTPTAISQTLNIAHGLGTTPGLVRITWAVSGSVNFFNTNSQGVALWDGTASTIQQRATPTGDATWSTSSQILLDAENTGPTTNWNASLSADGTNIILTTTSFSNTKGILILWEAFE